MERKAFLHAFYLLLALLVSGLLIIVILKTEKAGKVKHQHVAEKICIDLDQILERGRIDVSLGYNSLNYYILHGKPSGFQFELARYFANYLGVELNIWVTNDIHQATQALLEGKIDIVCADLTLILGRFGNDIVFTEPYATVSQVIVQNKLNPRHSLVQEPSQLRGKTIYIPRGTIFKNIIRKETRNLLPETFVVEVPEFGSEQLIDAVAEGKISFTVADLHLARYHQALYKNIDTKFKIGSEKPLAWCMRKKSPQLLDAFNNWIQDFKTTRQFKYLYHRYFINPWKEAFDGLGDLGARCEHRVELTPQEHGKVVARGKG